MNLLYDPIWSPIRSHSMLFDLVRSYSVPFWMFESIQYCSILFDPIRAYSICFYLGRYYSIMFDSIHGDLAFLSIENISPFIIIIIIVIYPVSSSVKFFFVTVFFFYHRIIVNILNIIVTRITLHAKLYYIIYNTLYIWSKVNNAIDIVRSIINLYL